MNRSKRLLRAGVLAGLLLAGAAARAAEPPLPDRDPHSYANPAQLRVTQVALDLSVDFKRKRLSGTSELQIAHVDPAARELLLDTRDLSIERVETSSDGKTWSKAAFQLAARDRVLGSKLSIAVPADAQRVRIRYTTAPQASALQWLTPAQTAGKRQPYLFTQSQAIHARSWIPLQDTPLVRMPYSARIRAPKNLRAVMSAEMHEQPAADGAWEFVMPQPIPSYLIALAVGDIAFRSTGERTGVYAEPSLLDRAAYEFAETEKTMELEEQLYGPYRWGRYDLLILPPSFPYGGMENPRLTFATPTVITGDRKLVSLVTHELSHSWSGNLVTNATWSDFWLNEGFTTYLTNRLNEAQYGLEFADMERVLGLQDLRDSEEQAEPADRVLVRATPAADPDEVFSSIPYERGALFLTWLESLYGRPAFDRFLRGWFDEHAFKSASTAQFLAYLDEHLIAQDRSKASAAQIDAWLHAPQIPAFAVLPRSDAFTQVESQRAAWLGGALATSALPTSGWAVQQWQHFLDTMPASVTPAQLQALDAQYGLSKTPNAIIASSWFRAAIAGGDQAVWPAAAQYLQHVGRMRLLGPIYRAWIATPDGRVYAQQTYAQARAGYHPIAAASVQRLFDERP
ncbi:M1 family metallopeptidase [Hydrocarboniphaga sp.]|uniref:M1 family metallopeptidase n=1 Tax=Hydrocarboniphaga sp. TaxID=2033016 RepID=UPI00263778DE|nr:M1 family metallopeptidase [Hydrocarboniphaga sp.]